MKESLENRIQEIAQRLAFFVDTALYCNVKHTDFEDWCVFNETIAALQAKDARIKELEEEVKQLEHGLLIANESIDEMDKEIGRLQREIIIDVATSDV